MSPEQAERLVRIEEKLTALSEAMGRRIDQLEEDVEALKKTNSRLLVAVVIAAGAGTPLGAIVGKFLV